MLAPLVSIAPFLPTILAVIGSLNLEADMIHVYIILGLFNWHPPAPPAGTVDPLNLCCILSLVSWPLPKQAYGSPIDAQLKYYPGPLEGSKLNKS